MYFLDLFLFLTLLLKLPIDNENEKDYDDRSETMIHQNRHLIECLFLCVVIYLALSS